MHNIADIVKNHRLYGQFSEIKERLRAHQFVCWIAGGAVRDFLIGREVKEFDLVTDAGTEVLKAIFPEAVLVGESFGVIKIPCRNGGFFDLATFREEADYVDGRRPSKVGSATPTKDSIRRDFTINAMFWDDENRSLRDYQGGRDDLEARVIRCVGDARVRFSEDHLRLFRLVRFAAQLGFRIDLEADREARGLAGTLAKVSGERLWAELLKLESSSSLCRAYESDLFRLLMGQVFECPMTENAAVSGDDLFLFLVRAYSGEDISERLKTRLKLSNRELKTYTLTKYLLERPTGGVEELFVECEKSPAMAARLDELLARGVMSAEIREKFARFKTECPESLVVPSDLLGMIPNNQIGSEISLIRTEQLRKKFTTKEQVLGYLKKKYADFNGKT